MDLALLPAAAAVAALIVAASVHGFSPMGTIATMWSVDGPLDTMPAAPGSYSICLLQATVLQVACFESLQGGNSTAPPDKQEFFALSGGGHFACGLDYGSHLVSCWGPNPPPLPPGAAAMSYTSIAAGGDHVCALRGDNSNVDCWGNIDQSPPRLAFASIVSGWGFSCALTREGAAICWGRLALDVAQPINETFSAIFAGGLSVCGVAVSGSLHCWGDNQHGQSSPRSSGRFLSIAGGLYHYCGIRAADRWVLCWGSNEQGQLAAPGNVSFSAIAAGDFYTCGVRLDHRAMQVLCWGNSVIFPPEVSLSVSPAPCVSVCGRDEYPFDKLALPCPVLRDQVCLECLLRCAALRPCVSMCVDSGFSGASSTDDRRTAAGRTRRILSLVLVSVASVLVLMSLLLWIGIYLQRKWKKDEEVAPAAKREITETPPGNRNDARVVAMSPLELDIATSSYSDEMILGRGAFGTVYKGVLENGQAVAIKRVSSSHTRSINLFEKELHLLTRTHHSCLVNLVGYCLEEKLLVFEFMSRGSLYDNLFHGSGPNAGLGWTCRIKLAAQAARGLEYLHKYANPTIIHRDIKSANILLDDDWNAHVSDFGLSLFGPVGSASHLSNMTIVGTPGYLDPEYGLSMKLTTKSDVYSFGVVLLELLSGEKPVDPFRPARHIVFWARELLADGALQAVLDSALEVPVPPEPLYRAVQLALGCSNVCGRERPSMTEVAKALEEILEELQARENIC